MLIKTSELTGAALDWAVETCEGYGERYMEHWQMGGDKRFIYCEVMHCPSSNWSHGGPIIEREKITVSSLFAQKNPPIPEYDKNEWGAYIPCGVESVGNSSGPTPLIAAMRCYVASTIGAIVEVPDELML